MHHSVNLGGQMTLRTVFTDSIDSSKSSWWWWNFSLHSKETGKTPRQDTGMNICFMSICFVSISLPSDVKIVCLAGTLGGRNVTKHDERPQFCLLLIYNHHLNCVLLFPSALFFFADHFLLLFHLISLSAAILSLPVSSILLPKLPLSITFITSILLTWMFSGWFHQPLACDF